MENLIIEFLKTIGSLALFFMLGGLILLSFYAVAMYASAVFRRPISKAEMKKLENK